MHSLDVRSEPDPVDLSIVVPVYNGSASLGRLVEEILATFSHDRIEVLLVNDGSTDDSEAHGRELSARHTGVVRFFQLARNFGEHNAVLAGLTWSRGASVGILDDDGQNPPAELRRMWQHLRTSGLDVVYGRPVEKQHSLLRNAGSWLNDTVATFLLRKPRSLYLSSFKVLSRPLVREMTRYQGPFPYLDALVLRSTDRIAQLDVEHRPRATGRSGYNLRRLVNLGLNMGVGTSLVPARALLLCGLAAVLLGLLGGLAGIAMTSLHGPEARLFLAVLFLAGLHLLTAGLICEYLGRLLMHVSDAPAFVLRDALGDAVRE